MARGWPRVWLGVEIDDSRCGRRGLKNNERLLLRNGVLFFLQTAVIDKPQNSKLTLAATQTPYSGKRRK